jgi:Tol biopolymer transport system component
MTIVIALVGGLLLPASASAGRAITEPCQTVFCAGVSGDGSRVVFPFEEELTAGAGNRQIYEWNGGAVRPLLPPSTGYWPQLDGVSADATHVFVLTSVPLSPGDTDGSGWDVYDIAGGAESLVSTGPLDPQTAVTSNRFAGASPDGSRVFFESSSKLTANDLDECPDLYQRSAGVTTLVGPNPDPPQLPLCEWAEFGGVSGDGSHFFFVSGVELESGDEKGEDIYQQVGTALTRLTTYPEPEWNCT